MKNQIKEQYKGMEIIYSPSREHRENNKIEVRWKIEAYRENQLKGSWEFIYMRVDPHNPNPQERMYVATMSEISQSGKNLVNKLINEGK